MKKAILYCTLFLSSTLFAQNTVEEVWNQINAIHSGQTNFWWMPRLPGYPGSLSAGSQERRRELWSQWKNRCIDNIDPEAWFPNANMAACNEIERLALEFIQNH